MRSDWGWVASARTAALLTRIEAAGYRVVPWLLFREAVEEPYAIEIWACPLADRTAAPIVARAVGRCDKRDGGRCARELARLVGLDPIGSAERVTEKNR
jgi:hypothetical protein